MENEKSRVTLPEMAKKLGISRAVAERLVSEYQNILPDFERVGITRIWPSDVVEELKRIIAEEQRLRGARR